MLEKQKTCLSGQTGLLIIQIMLGIFTIANVIHLLPQIQRLLNGYFQNQ